MTKSRQIREILTELRHVFGAEASELELVDLAGRILSSYATTTARDPKFSIASHAHDLASMDLVDAMADGGWRIMREERALMDEYYRDGWEPNMSAQSWGASSFSRGFL